MYAYVGRPGQHDEFYETSNWDETIKDFTGPVSKPIEIAYWRKHPSLHGYMEQLWESKGYPGGDPADNFNNIELELSWQDIDDLEQVIKKGKLPFTEGFFFGKPADNAYYEQDLEFCQKAKAELFLGLSVFYNSSW